jgi:hypothetical protein
MVLSFPDDVSDSSALAIAKGWCAEMFESQVHSEDAWEYVAALHTDTENPHVHVVLNNRGINGEWFSISSEGVFNPKMMRDRMTDIADDYGVRLESLTRADRGLYRDPISSAAVFAAREGRTLTGRGGEHDIPDDWRIKDMENTATLYTTLADFAETIGAPMIANRAHLSAAALFAGSEVPKGPLMSIDLDLTSNREDIRTSLIGWADQNKDAIEALPQASQQDIMMKIDAALTIIEDDAVPDLTEDTIWGAFKDRPSSYLIPDADRLEARAALYVDDKNADLLNEFVAGNVLDTYLVTGKIPAKFTPVLPAVAEAYREMHSHDLAEIPAEMNKYVRHAANKGLDPDDLRDLLINPIEDVAENSRIERRHIKTIMDRRGAKLYDVDAFEQALKVIEGAAAASRNHGTQSEEAIFENLSVGLSRATQKGTEADVNEAWSFVSDQLIDLAGQKETGRFTSKQAVLWGGLAAAIYDRHNISMRHANVYMVDRDLGLAKDDPAFEKSGQSDREIYDALKKKAEAQNDLLKVTMQPYTQPSQKQQVQAYVDAGLEYRELQLALGKVERVIIDNSKVYSRDGVSRVMQDAANKAAQTGRADLADSGVGRNLLTAFVALEGKEAMKEVANGNMDPLAEYVDTPANQRLVARELLKSARQVDVGLGTDDIEKGLEAVDPDYSRDGGRSL